MNAARFYELFEASFRAAVEALELRRFAGATSKWKLTHAVGTLTFAFATNFKTAGLLPHLPGEFRLRVSWARGKGAAKEQGEVSWFQYTTPAENAGYATLQRIPLEKFLSQDKKEPLRHIYTYANDPSLLPSAQVEEFQFYFDEKDVDAWGAWYGGLLPQWVARFAEAPETHEDWCWRVLWPHLKRAEKKLSSRGHR